MIESVFYQLFNRRQQFSKYGTELYIIGKDPISKELKDGISYYMSGDSEEVHMLVFDYDKKGMKEGFIVTNTWFLQLQFKRYTGI